MSILIPNEFSTYQLTEEELLAGSILTQSQQYVIQNQIATAAQAKLELIFDPLQEKDYGMQIAYQTGVINALRGLLTTSNELTRTVKS